MDDLFEAIGILMKKGYIAPDIFRIFSQTDDKKSAAAGLVANGATLHQIVGTLYRRHFNFTCKQVAETILELDFTLAEKVRVLIDQHPRSKLPEDQSIRGIVMKALVDCGLSRTEIAQAFPGRRT